jgi:cob(I)alamin adenosyltransferase
MKIYTKTGDKGETGLFGGVRVRKDDIQVEAYGTIDELNALLGVARASLESVEVAEKLRHIQDELFTLGAEVACAKGKTDRLKMHLVDEEAIQRLESWIDESESALPPLREFVLPDGTLGGAHLHLARTVARRAERRCWTLELRAEVLIYLNRLSDLLFVLARHVNHLEGAKETPWRARPSGDSGASS